MGHGLSRVGSDVRERSLSGAGLAGIGHCGPSLFLAYGYTGGPFPLAYRGLGEVFVVIFFGLIAVAGSVFIQTGGWPVAALLLGLQTGLLSAVLISINNLRDRAEDATTGKRTLAVRFGHRAAVAVIALELALAAGVGGAWIVLGHDLLAIAGVPIVFLGWWIFHGVRTQPPGPAYNRLLTLGGVLLLVFAAVFLGAALLESLHPRGVSYCRNLY